MDHHSYREDVGDRLHKIMGKIPLAALGVPRMVGPSRTLPRWQVSHWRVISNPLCSS